MDGEGEPAVLGLGGRAMRFAGGTSRALAEKVVDLGGDVEFDGDGGVGIGVEGDGAGAVGEGRALFGDLIEAVAFVATDGFAALVRGDGGGGVAGAVTEAEADVGGSGGEGGDEAGPSGEAEEHDGRKWRFEEELGAD